MSGVYYYTNRQMSPDYIMNHQITTDSLQLTAVHQGIQRLTLDAKDLMSATAR